MDVLATRIPSPDTNHSGLRPPHSIYETPWHGYPLLPGRELPQLQQSVPPYVQLNGLATPADSIKIHPPLQPPPGPGPPPGLPTPPCYPPPTGPQMPGLYDSSFIPSQHLSLHQRKKGLGKPK
jgi:hypothetical protein